LEKKSIKSDLFQKKLGEKYFLILYFLKHSFVLFDLKKFFSFCNIFHEKTFCSLTNGANEPS